jgi:hypothetical protein
MAAQTATKTPVLAATTTFGHETEQTTPEKETPLLLSE